MNLSHMLYGALEASPRVSVLGCQSLIQFFQILPVLPHEFVSDVVPVENFRK